ncbi:imidazolonepropionase-like domain-containing protein [Streptomyces thermolilacinus]|uniref:imidazolonepropionase-like domain-containing protein n=1 Tax=Streptomyces thermolilacinus TaxID=285540 RepID=UPI003410FF84
MLTIHTAGERGGAVAVDGALIAAVGPYEELAAAHPGARVRRWPGVLTPGLVNVYGPELLEAAYHPDPREADELGTEPITGPALATLALTEARRGGSARRGTQRLLAHGTVAVAGEPRTPAVRDAVRRAGLGVVPRAQRPEGVPSLDPFASGGPVVWAGPLRAGGPARFAVFDVPDLAELPARGAAACVATVLDGRLVYRAA